MNMDFGEKIYNTVVNSGVEDYKKLFDGLTGVSKGEYWKDIKKFYDALAEEEKRVFFNIVELVLIDATSHVFGLLDGVCGLVGGGDFESSVIINGEDMNNDLQDSFLAYVEEVEQNSNK